MGHSPDLDPTGRLRLVDSLINATGDHLASLQRLQSALVHDALEAPPDTVPDPDHVAALRREIGQLREALESRAVIERAKGMLMQAHGIPEDQAFQLLAALSRAHQQKLRDVAAQVATGAVDVRGTSVTDVIPSAGPRLVVAPPVRPPSEPPVGPATGPPADAAVGVGR